MRVVKYSKDKSREIMKSSSLKIFKIWLEKNQSKLF